MAIAGYMRWFKVDRQINSKRVYRLYREANLGVKKRRRRRGFSGKRCSIDIALDFGISGGYVTWVLDQVARFRVDPKAVRTEQGPEFMGKALDRWAYRNNIEIKLIRAGKPN